MQRLMAGFHSSNSEELKFGEQLQDDLINSFCDKIQLVCPTTIEALFAIQFLGFSDISDIQSAITGENHVCQVVYDARRSHYLLVHYDPNDHVVNVYDSMQIWTGAGEPYLFEETILTIEYLFGHIFGNVVYIQIDKEFEKQNDGFSCGYRVIGAIIALSRGQNPSQLTYSRSQILHFMQSILDNSAPKWEDFQLADIGREKDYSGDGIHSVHLYRNPSQDSEVSTNSEDAPISLDNASFKSCHDNEKSMISLNSFGSLENFKDADCGSPMEIDPTPPATPTCSPPIPMESSVFTSFLRMFNGFSLFRSDNAMKVKN